MTKNIKTQGENSASPDKIREDVLTYLYDRYKKSRSVKKQAASISEIKKALKPKGHKEQNIVGAISFLVDRDWVKEIKEKTKFFIKGKLAEGEKVKYRISDIGIVHFEGPSRFISQTKFRGINITNIQGVTVVGNNNIVRNEYLDLFNSLEELGELIRGNNQLTDEEKTEIQSDLETIKSQLSKATPNENVINIAWNSVKEKIEKISEIADKILKVASLIRIFTG